MATQVKNIPVTTTIQHPKLNELGGKSIRLFLQQYDAYSTEITARAQQLSSQTTSVSSHISKPIALKYCIHTPLLRSTIRLGLIKDVNSHIALSDEQLRKYLETKSEQNVVTLSVDKIDEIVNNELSMDMRDTSAKSRMERMFISYDMILEKHGLSWIPDKHRKLSAKHIIQNIKPHYLKTRIEGDLKLAHAHLKKDFNLFMDHAISVSEAFQIADSYNHRKGSGQNRTRPQSSKKSFNRNGNSSTTPQTSNMGGEAPNHANSNNNPRPSRPLPPCPFSIFTQKGANHLVRNCPHANEEQKKEMMIKLREVKNSGGPSTATRSQTTRTSENNSQTTTQTQPTTRRVNIKPCKLPKQPDNIVTVSDGMASLKITGRCDDGCDDSIVSAEVAEKASILGIGRITKIPMMHILLPLKQNDTKAISFQCQRTWTVPRTVLTLSSGQLALCNISYLVVDGDLTEEQMLIGLPVLQHLKVDTRTLLEQNRNQLDETDCISVGNPSVSSKGTSVKRLKTQNEEHLSQDYRTLQDDEDPFLEDCINVSEKNNELVQIAIESLINQAIEKGFPKERRKELEAVVFPKQHISPRSIKHATSFPSKFGNTT